MSLSFLGLASALGSAHSGTVDFVITLFVGSAYIAVILPACCNLICSVSAFTAPGLLANCITLLAVPGLPFLHLESSSKEHPPALSALTRWVHLAG